MTTLLQYKTAVTARGYDAVTAAPAILDAINGARHDVLDHRNWSFLEASASLATVAGTATVALTSITDLLRVDAVRLSLSGAAYPVSYLPPQQFKDRRQEDLLSRAAPSYWTIYDDVLNLWPVPDQAYTVTVDYTAKPADLAGDADTCPIPSNAKDTVAWGAAKYLAFRQRDPAAMQLAEAQFERGLARLARNDERQQRQTPSRVRQSGMFA